MYEKGVLDRNFLIFPSSESIFREQHGTASVSLFRIITISGQCLSVRKFSQRALPRVCALPISTRRSAEGEADLASETRLHTSEQPGSHPIHRIPDIDRGDAGDRWSDEVYVAYGVGISEGRNAHCTASGVR